jgi:hypothetical protein
MTAVYKFLGYKTILRNVLSISLWEDELCDEPKLFEDFLCISLLIALF